MKNSHRHFSNRQCKYFPCHQGVPPEEFNCLFCFCPLYHFEDCGGEYTLLDNGLKNCSACTRPHDRDGYEHVMKRLKRFFQEVKK